jgi:glycosyltransferase involved in cell wall biosynthesis
MIDIDQGEVIAGWKGDIVKPLVSILCDCFMHEEFLHETFEGFLSQKTTFPYEIIIHDDASTDNSAAIIKEYQEKFPLIVKPIYQIENQYSKKEINIWADFTFPKAKGKYIALCEGDDYWIDSLKLQKQVNFLENNNDYVICWTDYLNRIGDNLSKNFFSDVLPDQYSINFDNLFNPYCTLTLTCLFKKSIVDIKKHKDLKFSKDNTLYALALKNGRGVYLNFCSAVYRTHSGGIYSLKNPFFQRYSSYLNVKEIYDEIKEAQTENIKYIVDTLLKDSAFDALDLYFRENKLDIQQKNAIIKYLKQSKFSIKFKFLKMFLKNRFLLTTL